MPHLSSLQALSLVKDLLAKKAPQAPKDRFAEAKLIMNQLRKLYPCVFNLDTPMPLALGIEKEIKKAHPEFIVKSLKRSLFIWSKRPPYLMGIVQGTQRYHLDASPADPIQDSEKMYSQTLLNAQKNRLSTQTTPSTDPASSEQAR